MTASLMRRRVIDAAGTLALSTVPFSASSRSAGASGSAAAAASAVAKDVAKAGAQAAGTTAIPAQSNVRVELDGAALKVASFLDYCRLYCPPPLAAAADGGGAAPAPLLLSQLAYARLGEHWEVVVGAAGIAEDALAAHAAALGRNDVVIAQAGSSPADAPPPASDRSGDGLLSERLRDWNRPGVVASFVNGISTARGGTHVDVVADALVRRLAEMIQKKKPAPPSSPAAAAAAGAASASVRPTITPASIRSHLRIFVNCRVADASFDSQSKDALTMSPTAIGAPSPLVFPDRFLKAILDELGVADTVIEEVESKARAVRFASLARFGGGLNGLVGREVGPRHGRECLVDRFVCVLANSFSPLIAPLSCHPHRIAGSRAEFAARLALERHESEGTAKARRRQPGGRAPRPRVHAHLDGRRLGEGSRGRRPRRRRQRQVRFAFYQRAKWEDTSSFFRHPHP